MLETNAHRWTLHISEASEMHVHIKLPFDRHTYLKKAIYNVKRSAVLVDHFYYVILFQNRHFPKQTGPSFSRSLWKSRSR